ncbi:hypothetical protein EAS68_05420 [Legionella jordanis]|nr:hypothetical protein EAS68_05420 [Legionella jordanis]
MCLLIELKKSFWKFQNSTIVLQLANPASYYQGRKMEFLLDATNQLGLIQTQNWLCLLLLSSLNEVAFDP